MRRLIFITQQVDPGHPALAATVPKIRALAGLVDEVVVLADRVLPGTLPDNCRSLSFASRTKAGRGLRFEAALAKELAAEAGRDRRPHVPDLRRAGGAARAAARRPAASLVHALEAHADARSRREGVDGGRQRRPALVPDRLAEGGGHRPRHRPRRVPVPPGRSAGERLPRRVAGPLLAREGPRDDRPRGRAVSTACGWRCTVPRSPRPSASIAASSSGSSESSASTRASASTRRCCARRSRRSSAAPTASSTTWRPARPTRSSTRRARAACP